MVLTNESVVQKQFWDLLKQHEVSSISGVPFTYEMLKRMRFMRMNLPALKTLTQAGGKLSVDLVKEYLEYSKNNNKRFIVMYGQTEATARMSYLPEAVAEEIPSSIGKAIPGGRFEIVDSNKNIITQPLINGELVYYGDNVSLGYSYTKKDLCKDDENSGCLSTGDIAHFDKNGYYYITGRMKRFVKVFGNRVNLDALEQFVNSIYQGSACIGVDDKITICVTKDCNEDVLRDKLMEFTGLHKRAFAVQKIQKIPKSNSGKTLYSEIEDIIK